ncbi:MAG: hypothetical protein LUH53_10510, partial [Lachnospiraceae bacterium]|nr:hypothetical protein [Lachnospiraceae bacterium]
MENQEIYRLLQQVYEGSRTPEQAMEDMDSCLSPEMRVGNYADIDLHRAARQGMPEVIYGEGKTAEQIAGIIQAMTGRGVKNIMTTRLSAEKAEEVARMLGGTVSPFSAKMDSETLLYDPTSRIGIANAADVEKIGKVVVVAAGTSDLPVAEEAAVTAELNGSHVE